MRYFNKRNGSDPRQLENFAGGTKLALACSCVCVRGFFGGRSGFVSSSLSLSLSLFPSCFFYPQRKERKSVVESGLGLGLSIESTTTKLDARTKTTTTTTTNSLSFLVASVIKFGVENRKTIILPKLCQQRPPSLPFSHFAH